LIVGLGNPGNEYAETYHNVGFRVLDRIAEEQVGARQGAMRSIVRVRESYTRWTACCIGCAADIHEQKRRGSPPLFERFEASGNEMIVVYDDLALPVGKLRVRQKGSAGGHNGIKSIISTLGSDEFLRIRVGIQPDRETGDVREFVCHALQRSIGDCSSKQRALPRRQSIN
jgi:PTH1 family peptidyl-tRNA hydrolase